MIAIRYEKWADFTPQQVTHPTSKSSLLQLLLLLSLAGSF
jgi:hypothetical protein